MLVLIQSLLQDGHKRLFRNRSKEALVGRTRQYMTLMYSFSLGVIALLSVVIHFMLDDIILVQKSTGEMINISGQQRMLSQRSSSFAMEYLYTGDATAKQEALSALKTLEDNHHYLLQAHNQALAAGKPSPLSSALQKLYFAPPIQIDAQIKRYVQLLKTALAVDSFSRSQGEKPEFLTLARTDLLQGLHQVVAQYELESTQRINKLRQIQRMVLGVVILTLMLEAWYIFRPMVNRISGLTHQLHKEATHDPLSGLLNRRAFYTELDQAIADKRQNKQPFSLVVMDLDHFKRINDQYGHVAGDRVIQAMGTLLNTAKRASDCSARLGGEEFAVLLKNCPLAQAHQKAEQIRQQVEAMVVECTEQPIPVRCSGGVAEYQEDMTAELLYSTADAALYEAKQQGRNQIRKAVMAEDSEVRPVLF